MPFTIRNCSAHTLGLVLALAASVGVLAAAVHAETLTVGGTGSAAPLVEQFAQAYGRIKPDITVRLINPPMGSAGSIRAVLAGAIDLATPGKPLTDAEKAQGGQDWELGRTPFLVVTTQQPSPTGFTLDQLAAIYRGQVTAWADGSPIRLVLRSPTESDTLILRKLSPDMDAAVEAALARPGMLVAANDLDNLALLEKTPGALGVTNLGLMQGQNDPLRALAINGVAPSLSTLTQGTYPWFKSLYVVRGSSLSPTAQGFLDFMCSAAGRDVLNRAGYAPAPAPRQP